VLLHHDAREYNIAASEAAKAARTKFEAMIVEGPGRVSTALQKLADEHPDDYVVPAKSLGFRAQDDSIVLAHPVPDGTERLASLHRNALRQAADRADVPWTFVQRLQDGTDWKSELLARNLNEIFSHDSGRCLVRYVGDQARGLLSDKFRRMDSDVLVATFFDACKQFGALPVEGMYLETRVHFKAVLPHIFEPLPNEVMIYGISISNSDYGDGAFTLRSFLTRLWCTNYAVLDDELRKVHLGRRLTEDVRFSQETYELDTKAMASATRDVVVSTLAPEKVNKTMELVRKAGEESLSARSVADFLKKHLTKEEVAAATEIFTSADIEHLPPGQNRWRLSNAISWLAGGLEDGHRRLKLQEVAGEAVLAAA
jgi:hypothetical protein